MAIKSAAVFSNDKKGIARKVKKEVLSFLSSRGISISSRPQLVITIGGDGTVLYNKEFYGVPFFSIGSKTSFICQSDFSNWRTKLSRALTGGKVEKRLLLECDVNGRLLPPSLNEIGIRNQNPRVLSIHIQAGKRHFAFRADGVLFSTPTGSPAYCYSCGGTEMKAGERKYQAVAIAPFRRAFSPLILPGSANLTLRISGKERGQIFIDGQEFGFLKEKDTMRVRASKTAFLFAKV
jgi:NAD+ kinase